MSNYPPCDPRDLYLPGGPYWQHPSASDPDFDDGAYQGDDLPEDEPDDNPDEELFV